MFVAVGFATSTEVNTIIFYTIPFRPAVINDKYIVNPTAKKGCDS